MKVDHDDVPLPQWRRSYQYIAVTAWLLTYGLFMLLVIDSRQWSLALGITSLGLLMGVLLQRYK